MNDITSLSEWLHYLLIENTITAGELILWIIVAYSMEKLDMFHLETKLKPKSKVLYYIVNVTIISIMVSILGIAIRYTFNF